MLRRLLPPLVIGLALLANAGCADAVSPAARVGDVTISNEELLDEVAEWAASPTLLAMLGVGSIEGDGPGSYSTAFVDFVLGNRISFEIHRAQFAKLDLELSVQDLRDVRAGLFQDPEATQAVLEELGTSYSERLVEDVARQFVVQQEMGDGYDAWAAEAFGADEIEVNPRYGTWDRSTGIVPPEGPIQPAGNGFQP